jgi:acetate kinase
LLVLVLNAGSSSLKFKLLEMPSERILSSGLVERIGESGTKKEKGEHAPSCPDHGAALQVVLDRIVGNGPGVVAHRFVHGKDRFSGPVFVDEQVIMNLEQLSELAPLHMPAALSVLRASMERLPGARHVACFDTTFFHGMPQSSYLYAVPESWSRQLGIRRYGFHGLSHQHAVISASAMTGIDLKRIRAITAHLGNGASITAYDRGRVIDTSMGFTPLEGLIMGTRSGDLDPAAPLYVQEKTGMSPGQVLEVLNSQSGLAALSGCGRDIRTILDERARGNSRAGLAVEMYATRIRKYLGAYFFLLCGADCIVFTGGVGENAWEIREMVLEGLEPMGIELDREKNRRSGVPAVLSREGSALKILLVPCDEELMIARLAHSLCHADWFIPSAREVSS